MQEIQVQSLVWEDPLEKEMAIHSSTIAWKIPWTEEPGRLQSMMSQSRTWLSDFTFTFTFFILTCVRWYLIVVLICISLIISDVEHLFICFLAICMFSLEKCLYIFWPIFGLGHLFFWYWAAWADCVFWRLSLCHLLYLRLFSPILKALFTLLIVSFIVQKLLSLIRSHLFIFAFISITMEGGS